MRGKKKRGVIKAAGPGHAQQDEEPTLQHEGRIVRINQPSTREGKQLRPLSRKREAQCLTVAWCRQQPFGRELAREVRRLYGIPRGVAPLGWLLAGMEMWCRGVLWLLSKFPLPSVVHSLFRSLDAATCGGLQWLEGTRQSARRGEPCPAWRRVVGALIAAGVAPPAVLWGRWLSRQQRLFLQEAGVPCPPSEDPARGVFVTSIDILQEIMAEISAAFLGRAEDMIPGVAQKPALDTVAEEDEELDSCHRNDGPDSEEEETISLWELCPPEEETVKAGHEPLTNDGMELEITNQRDGVDNSISETKNSWEITQSNAENDALYTDALRQQRSTFRRNRTIREMDDTLPSPRALFHDWLPSSPPPTFSQLYSLDPLPCPLGVEGPSPSYRGQDPAWNMLLQLYCNLYRMMLIIPMLLMTVVMPDLNHEASNHRSSSSPQHIHSGAYEELENSSFPWMDDHWTGNRSNTAPQHPWGRTSKSDPKRPSSSSSCSSDDADGKETPVIESIPSSERDANVPMKKKSGNAGRKGRSTNPKKVSQKHHDFIEPGLSDYEEETWLQLGTRPQESKKEGEETDIKQIQDDDFEEWLNEESGGIFDDIPDGNGLNESDSFYSCVDMELENDDKVEPKISPPNARKISRCDKTDGVPHQFSTVTGSEGDVSAQNSHLESKKPSLTRSVTYILQTKSATLDSYTIPNGLIHLPSDEMKAVKDQTNCKTRTKLLNADPRSEILPTVCKKNVDMTNSSAISKNDPHKNFRRGAQIAKPVAKKFHTDSNSSSGRNISQNANVDKLGKTANSLHKTSAKPTVKMNSPKQRTNPQDISAKNTFCSSGNQGDMVSEPILKTRALNKYSKTQKGEPNADEKHIKQKTVHKNISSGTQVPSSIDQQNELKPWRSCCMNARNKNKEPCCTGTNKKSPGKAS